MWFLFCLSCSASFSPSTTTVQWLIACFALISMFV
jgi:hypothetical protein